MTAKRIIITFDVDDEDPALIDPYDVGEYLQVLAADDRRVNGDEVKVTFVEAEWSHE